MATKQSSNKNCHQKANQSFALSPLTKLALSIYNKTYHFVPSLAVDICFKHNFCILEIQKPNNIKKLWMLTCFGLMSFICLCVVFVLSVPLISSSPLNSNDILQMVAAFFIFITCILIMCLGHSCFTNRDSVKYINQLITNNLPIRK